MKIVVLACETAFDILKNSNADANWVRVESPDAFSSHPDADAFFDLGESAGKTLYPEYAQPLFVNSVLHCTGKKKKIIRINGWNGFLQHSSWEIAGAVTGEARAVLAFLHKTIIETADEPGLISPRIIAMIINEAFYAREENVSTEAEIDTAMKLGTNYPYGPFEWAEKIGLRNILSLLLVLSSRDKKYTPAASLVKATQQL